VLKIKLTVFGLLLLAAAGVHGTITQRWSNFAPDAGRREAMHALVVQHGDGETGVIEHDVPLKEMSTATSRRYLYTARGFAANTCIISGVPGAVATHTPDVCYTSSGYTMIRAPKRLTVPLADGSTATYMQADFEKTKATQTERVRVRWAWSTKGVWDAPDYARFRYLQSPELFKLYIVTTLPAEADSADDAPAVMPFVAAAFSQYASVLAREGTTPR